MDYADQRYYSWAGGRFATPDPACLAAVDPANPSTWNRYSYVNGDPVNSVDPSGLDPISGLPPVVSGPGNCSTPFIFYAQNFGETIEQFFNSPAGVLGVMSFFEDEGSLKGPSGATKSAWAAMDWTFYNQWGLSPSQKSAFYGGNNVPATFIDTVTQGSNVFTQGQLNSGFYAQLVTILTGSVNSVQCGALVDAVTVASGVVKAATNDKTIPEAAVSNSVPGALQFASGGTIPGHGPNVVEQPVAAFDGFTFYQPVARPTRTRPGPPKRKRPGEPQ
jgi:RHS repeat-associated protein